MSRRQGDVVDEEKKLAISEPLARLDGEGEGPSSRLIEMGVAECVSADSAIRTDLRGAK